LAKRIKERRSFKETISNKNNITASRQGGLLIGATKGPVQHKPCFGFHFNQPHSTVIILIYLFASFALSLFSSLLAKKSAGDRNRRPVLTSETTKRKPLC